MMLFVLFLGRGERDFFLYRYYSNKDPTMHTYDDGTALSVASVKLLIGSRYKSE